MRNEVRGDLRSGRRIKLQFRGAGGHPFFLERRNGLAEGNHFRLAAGDRFSGRQILAGVQ